MSKGQDFLIWSSWSGFLLHIQTLGLPTKAVFNVAYRVIDLKKNEAIGSGLVILAENVDLGESTARDVFEKDDLSGLKSRVGKMLSAGFRGGNNDKPIGQKLGLSGPQDDKHAK